MPIAMRYDADVAPISPGPEQAEQARLDAGTPKVEEPVVNAGWGYDPEKD